MSAANNLYEARDWQSPVTMARELLARHRDLSTVRAMVVNEFGRGPGIEDLREMQQCHDEADLYLSRRFASTGFEENAVQSMEDHERHMARASRALAARIQAVRAGKAV